ncbi:acyl-CoA/acyl-ACP dehydrogenase [Aestuariicella hydrocarbonica]|uniref:Acyl-CoA/acyl-ACP dehydrogenase n=1 Tax=Pseudomaricurvus hydrocarbonicus TaxID=1470433 RepID=A0A9E5MN41_9GAMM|nr:acyl-CoA dehydrogenase family protein [Aestuariicella hydrocarbonica]NHO67267.1 acyl-CoA/acyl-ACP dehydrogenase [Aestuariicella hydrocarbonica]
MKLTGEYLVENMEPMARSRAEVVESVLPIVREMAREVDEKAAFHMPHVKTFSDSGLLGLIIPQQYGGLGGDLKDLSAACFALGTACPSTALAFFFHCSAASRGLLAMEALEEGLFSEEEAPIVRRFAEQVLYGMGRDGLWFANFASESVKSEQAAVTISTTAKKVEGGYLLNGVKSFGTGTGVADRYLVTASLEGYDTAEGLCTFFVDREGDGVNSRAPWNAMGMRGSSSNGIVLENYFVPDDKALAIPGAFTRCMQMSRGSFVGNQMAAICGYAGAAFSAYRHALDSLTSKKFADTGKPIGSAPFQQELIGKMMVDLETALLWLRRQLELETSEPPLLPKHDVVKQWRLCKGVVAEAGFSVAVNALKASGTSGTMGDPARYLRELAMGIVQAFPAERGRLMAAQMEVEGSEQSQFGVGNRE